MRIKLKGQPKSVENTSVSLEHWHKEYSKNDKYLNYDFYDVPNIVELHEINKDIGKLHFVRCTFENTANHLINQNRNKYTNKPLSDGRLDEYLMPVKKNQAGSFFKRIVKRIKQMIKPKSNPNKIPFSRYELRTIKIGLITIIATIVIPVILFIIDKVYFS